VTSAIERELVLEKLSVLSTAKQRMAAVVLLLYSKHKNVLPIVAESAINIAECDKHQLVIHGLSRKSDPFGPSLGVYPFEELVGKSRLPARKGYRVAFNVRPNPRGGGLEAINFELLAAA
jgi:hypothetical protein